MVTQVTNFGRSGLADWLVQRATAVIMLAYLVFMVGYLVSNPDLTFDQWKALFDQTWMAAFSTATLLAIVAHAWIGLWAVSTDYMTTRMMGAKATVVRLAFQAGYSIILFYYLVWGIKILWG
ncbi:Succinate dehydrogenase hydrophobic membrane anchor subunit [BD1-7 clade bacterium]|uniref:Succinate dehydrogenase hydrophobic membrane anchor subunit n=1 Tax=BD1-7 clade bacterium TaxID=2029982 RepID=A0A5S9PVT0_9GAMM|nr:Succinate dehydrogenase hydrophobic membrane anchor subunit [BD1-7 clade bacterium]CAA0096469.1 Succinate dehydrogenase hydrophobic membrane anchor subunit [BD1-7 clade bacterium]CAA0109023.1 Succinate dehydrogenase hydrophobic membrane anchor subunit [BD1-7 clade bacterium]CAA0115794.1 Succinate dehydrogenase hydrophobic membrane anchor subunit [BD1-7 clade bacterium]CAA0119482.1 Succinate dehydrogenase hydrophobic membrane anchor subunit [BD1-7 clade bacterium]